MKLDNTLYKLRSYSILSVLILSLAAPVVHANGLDEGYARRRVEVGCEIDYGDGNGPIGREENSSGGSAPPVSLSSSSFAGLGNAGGPWTQPGTKEYQIAQIAFRILTEEYGLSGYSAAGWLGNIQSESGFDPNIIEAENGQNYSSRGFGLFQFTPAEKFTRSKFYNPKANLEDSVRAQIAFVWESEFKNQYAFTAAKGYVTETYSIIGSKWFDYNNIKPEHFLDSESPEKAMYYFFAGYERGNYHLMHETRRRTAAQVADKLFNQKKVKADPSKWKFGEGVNTNYTPKVTMASAYEGGEDCEDTTEKTSSAPTELLKKWEEVLDFKPKGDGIGSGIDMDFQFGSQCFDLIRYYLSKMITDKDGNHFEVNLAGAEGANQIGSVAGSWSGGWEVRQMGDLDPQDLKPGDVLFGNLPTESTYGHTVIILSEVNDTGDFLYIDQNTPRPSINKGNLNTWVKGQVGYVRPPAGWKMANNVIVEEYINDNVPTYPGGWRGGHGASWAKATPEDIQQLAGN